MMTLDRPVEVENVKFSFSKFARRSLSVGAIVLMASQTWAAEVDSFTYREIPLKDSLKVVNKLTNRYFKKAVKEANASSKHPCDEMRLYKHMRKYFNNHYQGDLGKELVATHGIDAHWITIEESVYQDFTWYESPIQGLWGRVAADPTAALIKVNGVFMGTDKFEHFMGTGFRYFKTHYLKNKSIDKALDIGWSAETGMLGAWMTGVMSYGDMTANFNGMRFWNDILHKNEDILGEEYSHGPYLKCDEDKWVVVEEINWANYIDQAFDEAQNCNKYPDQKMLDMVEKRISDVGKHYGVEMKCPMNRATVEPLIQKYGVFSDELLNLEGDSIVPKNKVKLKNL